MALAAVDKLGSVFRGADLEASLSMLAVNMANKVGPNAISTSPRCAFLRLTVPCEPCGQACSADCCMHLQAGMAA